MNYTKGKWVRLRDSSIIAEGKLNDGFVISDCYGPDADANSTLISSAPGLLEALKLILDRYTGLINCGDCGNWNPEDEAEVIKARAAIAAARGE